MTLIKEVNCLACGKPQNLANDHVSLWLKINADSEHYLLSSFKYNDKNKRYYLLSAIHHAGCFAYIIFNLQIVIQVAVYSYLFIKAYGIWDSKETSQKHEGAELRFKP